MKTAKRLLKLLPRPETKLRFNKRSPKAKPSPFPLKNLQKEMMMKTMRITKMMKMMRMMMKKTMKMTMKTTKMRKVPMMRKAQMKDLKKFPQ